MFFRVFCCHFSSFYFLNALQSDINSNRVYVLGHEYVLGPSQTHFSPRLAARAKMSLSRAQNIFMPANINSIVISYREGTERLQARESGKCEEKLEESR